ncbi:CRTAC1 family protein (plasmid) [Streptomyces clavuligerus]|nr:UnbV [Streptomyces clavuligerus]QCS10670.1 CRTAC1 family protein [Streptomyces clavuligerus]QPJ97293.1 RNA-binding protein [Streptomyces clavuligerus]
MASTFYAVRLPTPSEADVARMASGYSFRPMSVSMPSGFDQQTIRKVNRDYKDIAAWISSVGAGVAMNDVDGDGLSNDLCVTDPRIDQVVVTPTPGKAADRYRAFALDPAPLPMSSTMAPMGCAAGDFNEDGVSDLIVYYWGRTPVLFHGKPTKPGRAAKGGAPARAVSGAPGKDVLTADSFEPAELVRDVGRATYTGPQWNTNAITIADFDGDGHEDILIGNYFPDSPVLDPTLDGGVEMNDSLSHAQNGGEDFVYRWTPDGFERADGALPKEVRKGWTLGAAATDLDGDHLPELYLAHDFGTSRLLHNRSSPGKIRFSPVDGPRDPLVPRSKQLGRSSFKGMGVDFGDLDGDGLHDMFVSNITTSFGIQESNFTFINKAANKEALSSDFKVGRAPFEDRSVPLGTAWSGWGWDVKTGDFDNSGELEIVQTTGFVKGKTNRWPQLQELATTNDGLTHDPDWWPHVKEGDDIGGDQTLRFFAKGGEGRYLNVAKKLGMAIPIPTRGVATGDADGDGRLDLAVARQWGEPVFYSNRSQDPGAHLGLTLTHPSGSPVVDTQVTVVHPDGSRHVGRVDGGGGHSGKRSHEVHIGLGDGVEGPLKVQLRWRDRTGQVRDQELKLAPGRHSIELGTTAKEK